MVVKVMASKEGLFEVRIDVNRMVVMNVLARVRRSRWWL